MGLKKKNVSLIRDVFEFPKLMKAEHRIVGWQTGGNSQKTRYYQSENSVTKIQKERKKERKEGQMILDSKRKRKK